ncbi:hypothetical protein INT46_010668 [Mucor plumbeus]|uniref:Homeobox domain-containing protein n=1 Tax=Mucor plumbeus TaxID=97098 RepID=A0A8H7R3D8_9FUNG|nr:hypothetical protein INT46_010668 [Mucor plumbeus]
MLSVRNLLIEPQSQPQVHHDQQKSRPSVLNISSLLNDQNDSFVQIMISKPQQPQQHNYTHRHHHYYYYYHNQANCTHRSPPLSPSPPPHPNPSSSSSSSSPLLPSCPQTYYLIGKCQRRSSRQHQIESRKIEQELLNKRRQSAPSTSLSSVYLFSTARSNTNLIKDVDDSDNDDNDDDDNLPLKAKRRRASSKQLDVLNKVFERTFFPSTQLRAELGRQLGMSPRTVQIWFQNRRQAIRTRERFSSSRENSTSPE